MEGKLDLSSALREHAWELYRMLKQRRARNRMLKATYGRDTDLPLGPGGGAGHGIKKHQKAASVWDSEKGDLLAEIKVRRSDNSL